MTQAAGAPNNASNVLYVLIGNVRSAIFSGKVLSVDKGSIGKEICIRW